MSGALRSLSHQWLLHSCVRELGVDPEAGREQLVALGVDVRSILRPVTLVTEALMDPVEGRAFAPVPPPFPLESGVDTYGLILRLCELITLKALSAEKKSCVCAGVRVCPISLLRHQVILCVHVCAPSF